MSKENVTPELINKVKAYLNDSKYSELSQTEIGLLCGTSASTVSRISRGEYDRPKVKTEGDFTTVIPYEEFARLVKCDYAINEIVRRSVLSEKLESSLFTPSMAVNDVLLSYFPDLVQNRLEELREEGKA